MKPLAMNGAIYVRLLDLAAGGVLVAAVLVLWRRSLTAIVRMFALQGAALAAVALILGLHEHSLEHVLVAGFVFLAKGIAIPAGLQRAVSRTSDARETEPLVNVPASLVAAALLTMVAYATTRGLVKMSAEPAMRAVPLGFAVILVGFFTLVTRRKAIAQVVGFLLLENGIALVAFLLTAGVPLIVELGASLDVLLAALVLQVFAARMQLKFGDTDLDQLRELKD